MIKEPLIFLEKEYGVTQTEALRQAEEHLVEWGFLDKSNQFTYQIKIELVRRWLVKRYPLRQEIRQLDNLDQEAVTLEQQSGDLINAINRYEQVLIANPNHFGALFNLTEVWLKNEKIRRDLSLYDRAYKFDPIRNKESFLDAIEKYHQEFLFYEQQFEPELEDRKQHELENRTKVDQTSLFDQLRKFEAEVDEALTKRRRSESILLYGSILSTLAASSLLFLNLLGIISLPTKPTPNPSPTVHTTPN